MESRSKPRRSGQLLKDSWPELLLAFCGLLALGYCWAAHLTARAAMRDAEAATQTGAVTSVHAPARDGVMGIISIPQLHLSAPITSGVGKIELIRGVGHIPGTAVPGGLGTMALAGHRDTFFRSLRNVTAGMRIKVSSDTGTYQYQIDSTEVVNPDQLSVLDIGSKPALVLITCYPFHYIGAAPQRFIVHAHLLSVASEATP